MGCGSPRWYYPIIHRAIPQGIWATFKGSINSFVNTKLEFAPQHTAPLDLTALLENGNSKKTGGKLMPPI